MHFLAFDFIIIVRLPHQPVFHIIKELHFQNLTGAFVQIISKLFCTQISKQWEVIFLKPSNLPIQGLLKENLNQHSSYYSDSVYLHQGCIFIVFLSYSCRDENVELDLLVSVVRTTDKCNSTWLVHHLVIENISNGFHFSLKLQQFYLWGVFFRI